MIPENEKDKGYRVDGMKQVVDMLAAADPSFRESLLRRIAAKDRKLAASLLERLLAMGILR